MTTHGLYKHPLYKVWCGMKDRCYLKTAAKYGDYGGRGITVCDAWRYDFETFYEWATDNGYEAGLTLERSNNAVGYSPDNCQWATRSQQNRNTRRNVVFEINGKSLTLAECVERHSTLSYMAVYQRLRKGWPLERALVEPVNVHARNRNAHSA